MITADEFHSKRNEYINKIMRRAIDKVIAKVKLNLKNQCETWEKDSTSVNTRIPDSLEIWMTNVNMSELTEAAKELTKEGFKASAHSDETRSENIYWISIKTTK